MANGVGKSEYDLARQRVEEEVSQHIGLWADAIGLTHAGIGPRTDPGCHTEADTTPLKAYSSPEASASGRWSTPVVGELPRDDYWQCFARFCEDVTEALHAFMRAHIATPGRWRWSTVRKAFLDVADDYAALSKLLRHWESGHALPPLHLDPRFEDLPRLTPEPAVLGAVLAPFGNSAKFGDLAKAARRYAAQCVPDEGSRPRFVAFDSLCVGLVGGFMRATTRKATSSGDYFRLVEAVWPVACGMAETVTKRPVESNIPTSATLRKRVQRLLERLERNGVLERLGRDP